MKHLISLLAILAVLIVAGCNLAPYSFPDNGVRANYRAIDSTLITVKKEFRYVPTLTSYVLPAGDYVPVRSDAGGTYYASPRGILVLSATGGFVVEGGIYRKSDPTAYFHFAIYLKGWPLVELHSMWGLNLNEKIECNPPFDFKL